MDPEAALRMLLDAIINDDRDMVLQHLEDLHQWVERGGFLPNLHKATLEWRQGITTVHEED